MIPLTQSLKVCVFSALPVFKYGSLCNHTIKYVSATAVNDIPLLLCITQQSVQKTQRTTPERSAEIDMRCRDKSVLLRMLLMLHCIKTSVCIIVTAFVCAISPLNMRSYRLLFHSTIRTIFVLVQLPPIKDSASGILPVKSRPKENIYCEKSSWWKL